MENIGHTLTGLAAGELIHRLLPAEKDEESGQIRRRLLLTVSALAGNFPDLDLLLTPLLAEPLGYLLHHRGHTHTFLYAPPQAAFLGVLIPLIWKRARQLLFSSGVARLGYLILLILGFLFHLGLDALNSYGIHAMHPFDSDWSYGDAVFVVEPVFWFLFAPPLLKNLSRKKALFFFALPVCCAGAFAYLNFISLGSALALILAGGCLWALPSRLSLFASFGAAGFYISLALWGSGKANHILDEHYSDKGQLVDAAISAYPSHLGCWMFSSVVINNKSGRYSIEKGALSLFPGAVAAGDCPCAFGACAESSDSTPNSKIIAVYAKKSYSLDRAKEMYKRNCFFQAFMRFARIPAVEPGRAWDARFERGEVEDNFSFLNLQDFKGESCPRSVPGWEPPRQDLLR